MSVIITTNKPIPVVKHPTGLKSGSVFVDDDGDVVIRLDTERGFLVVGSLQSDGTVSADSEPYVIWEDFYDENVALRKFTMFEGSVTFTNQGLS